MLPSTLRFLIALVLGLPIVSLALAWIAGLLRAMGDSPAADVLNHMNTATQVTWLVSLVGMVVVLGLESLDRQREE